MHSVLECSNQTETQDQSITEISSKPLVHLHKDDIFSYMPAQVLFGKKNWGKFGLRLLSKGKKMRRQGGLLTKFANDVDATNRPKAEASIAANCQAVSRLSILPSNKNSSNLTEETRVQLHLTYETLSQKHKTLQQFNSNV